MEFSNYKALHGRIKMVKAQLKLMRAFNVPKNSTFFNKFSLKIYDCMSSKYNLCQ